MIVLFYYHSNYYRDNNMACKANVIELICDDKIEKKNVRVKDEGVVPPASEPLSDTRMMHSRKTVVLIS